LNAIGKLLFEYRKHYKFTQKELVNILSNHDELFCSLNTVTLSRWETGITTPNFQKKQNILKFLSSQNCFEHEKCNRIVKELYQKLYEPLSTIFTRKYQYLIGNLPTFHTEKHSLKNLKIFQHKEEYIEHIIDIEIATNATNYYAVTNDILEKWCKISSTFCMVVERKKQHLGHFIMLKLKNSVAKDIAFHKRSEFSLNKNDFCDINENGTYFVHALYGRNPQIAAELNIAAYLHLFENIKHVDNVMIFSSRVDGVLLTKDYGIEVVASGVNEEYDFEWYGMLSPVEDILFSQTVIKSVF
jgi:transcriptional regulator with XRE-family HTH domain